MLCCPALHKMHTVETYSTYFIMEYTIFHQINAPGAEAEKDPRALVRFWWNSLCGLTNTYTISAERLIQIGSGVSEIWPGEVESRGVRLFKQARLFSEIRYMVSQFARFHSVPPQQFLVSWTIPCDIFVKGVINPNMKKHCVDQKDSSVALVTLSSSVSATSLGGLQAFHYHSSSMMWRMKFDDNKLAEMIFRWKSLWE